MVTSVDLAHGHWLRGHFFGFSLALQLEHFVTADHVFRTGVGEAYALFERLGYVF